MFKNINKKLFFTFLIYFISLLLFAGVRIASILTESQDFHPELSSMLFGFIIQILIMFLIPLGLYYLLYKKEGGVKRVFENAQFKKIKPKVIIISLLLGILVFFVNIAVSTVFNGIISFLGYRSSGVRLAQLPLFSNELTFIINIVFVAVLPAFCEEFLHRGIVLHEANKLGYRKGILISGLLFGLIHFNISQFSYAFVIGLIISFVAIVSKNIWPAIIIHFTNNFIIVYLSSAKAYNWFGGNFYEVLNEFLVSNNGNISFIATFSFLFFVSISIFYLIMELFKENTIVRVNDALNKIINTTSSENSPYSPSLQEKHRVLNEILLTKSNINIRVDKKSNPIDVVLPINKNVYVPSLIDKMFYISSLVLGISVTLFTFIWGLL